MTWIVLRARVRNARRLVLKRHRVLDLLSHIDPTRPPDLDYERQLQAGNLKKGGCYVTATG